MSLLQLKNASVLFGHPPLIDGVELVVQPGERLCLVGRNGCGKSTLLKVIAGELPLDDGQRLLPSSTRIARLEQDPPLSAEQSVFEFVAGGMPEASELLSRYFKQIQLLAHDSSEAVLKGLEQLQSELEHQNAWQFEQAIEQVLSQLQLDGNAKLASLSGGWRRKAALARALVGKPDILLLDEPTNHLDVSMIEWLQQAIADYPGAVVFVSHDRAFIRALATRIVDLDRGKLTSYPGNYAEYLAKKAEDLAIESAHNKAFDKVLSQEEAWIRQGIKARRTRNEGRVRALKALRQEHADRRKQQGRATATVQHGQSSGKLVFECQQLTYRIDNKPLISNLTFTLLRGDKLALIGPNGCGKSTLVKLLLGELTAHDGKLREGVNIELAYFDQHRMALDQNATVIDAVADGKKEIDLNGHSRHVISYLQDFLFTPQRVNVPVSALSGGEKNRLLLAKLLAKPSNLLILDEPTNDLDIETLELLEDILAQYTGTVILVSHDREFVDNVATNSLFFAGNGELQEFIGGYQAISQWYAERQQEPLPDKQLPKTAKSKASAEAGKKLSYKLKRELDALPAQIEDWENKVEALQKQVNEPTFFSQPQQQSSKILTELADSQAQLEQAYARWDELDSMQQQ